MLTYTKLNWDREVVHTSLFRNNLTAWNAWEVDECRLNDTLLSFNGFHELFGEALGVRSANWRKVKTSRDFKIPESCVCH